MISPRICVLLKLLMLQSTITAASNKQTANQGFTYNEDAECSYPFSDFQISTVRCTGSSGIYVQGYNDYGQESLDDESICNFGDTLSIVGTTTLSGTAPKQFTVAMKVCYGGSDWPTYDPQTCKKSRTTLDLTDYARLQDAEYYDEEVDESEYYVQEGTYAWRVGFSIPKKSFYFGNGTSALLVFTGLQPYLIVCVMNTRLTGTSVFDILSGRSVPRLPILPQE